MLVSVHVLSVYDIFRQATGTNLFLDLLYDFISQYVTYLMVLLSLQSLICLQVYLLSF